MVETFYDGAAKLKPACDSKEHEAAREAARTAEREEHNRQWQAQRDAEAAASEGRRERLDTWLLEHPADPFTRQLAIYAFSIDGPSGDTLVEKYLAGEDEDAHDARDDALWDAVLAIPADELDAVFLGCLADTVLDEWRLSKTVLEAIDARTPRPAKKGRKGAS
jgi:hypothetical protein